jgi:predicted nucleic acid-binding protein
MFGMQHDAPARTTMNGILL